MDLFSITIAEIGVSHKIRTSLSPQIIGEKIDVCELIKNSTFLSVKKYESNLSPATSTVSEGLRWQIKFEDKTFSWLYTDIAEMGTYTCEDNNLVAEGADKSIYVGSYNTQTGILLWDGVEYTKSE